MESIKIYVGVEGMLGGAFPLDILSVDAENPFSWLLGKVQDSRIPGMANKDRYVEYFRTATGVVIPWADTIDPYLEKNTRDNPIEAVVRNAASVIPESFQKNLAVVADVIRSRSTL